jgi:hypothetical protein
MTEYGGQVKANGADTGGIFVGASRDTNKRGGQTRQPFKLLGANLAVSSLIGETNPGSLPPFPLFPPVQEYSAKSASIVPSAEVRLDAVAG